MVPSRISATVLFNAPSDWAASCIITIRSQRDPGQAAQMNFLTLRAHLRRILDKYAAYYNKSRIHRSLDKDAPFHRPIERFGVITSQPVLGGLHHQYCRI